MSVKCQFWLGNLSTPVIWMVIPVIKAEPGHLAAIMVMCCSVTVGHSVQLLLCLIWYWKRLLLGFGLKLHGLEIEKACGNATWPRYRGWKEPHHLERITQDCTSYGTQLQATTTPLGLPPKWVTVTAHKWPSSQTIPSIPIQADNFLCLQRTLLLLPKHLQIMTGISLSSKPLHLPVSSRSACAPCPPHSMCCVQNWCISGWYIADFSALGLRHHYSHES